MLLKNRELLNQFVLYFFILLFAGFATLGLCYENYLLAAIPFILLIVLLAFCALDKLLLLVAFFTPLSLPLAYFIAESDFDLHLPTEPILIGIVILFALKLLLGHRIDKKILLHPVSLAIDANLVWIFITCCTSTMPLVSFKFLLSRLWFVIPFYFLGTQLFRKLKNIRRFFWCYIFTLLATIIIITIHHASHGFTQQAANAVPYPFFNDHTAYGAIIAMFIPFILLNTSVKQSIFRRSFISVIMLIVLVALVLSYTRAAWISIVIAILTGLAIHYKVKFKLIALGGLVCVFVFSFYWTDLLNRMESNRKVSSSDITQHIESISNISNDPSNVERLNRWASAFRMFKEKPIFGWGPGTYMFQYAPYQVSYEKTVISTNSGDMGNAHSEYIGPLTESGVLGTLTYLTVLITAIYTGIKVYSRSSRRAVKIFVLSVVLGLTTYAIHGFVNNFLDTDKASVPFWAFMAIIVALDVYFNPEKQAGKNQLT
ncbi:MAG: O-antigen ligase family protein [Bacteroidota bacterium]|nr:O-antigen ligase family protein [Bacteroidota bacterium]